ncbi:MAG: AraC family transcriptional regulator [Clostridiales bacterium]|nr:MAG: AraC family transcriptional regulator [Clostridiales bacterium]RGB67269.1 AraC family transcriptional regulator [Harryflintia acetispora]
MEYLDTGRCPVLGQGPTHLYLTPHPLLRPYVAHYTLCSPRICAPRDEGPRPPAYLELVPDASGCVVLENDGGRLSSRLWGPTTKMARVENDLCSGPLRFFIEFLPGGMSALTGWAQAELADRRLPLWQVSPGLERALFEALESSRDLSGLIARMDEILLSQREIGLPAPLREAMAALQCSGGMLPVRQLGALGHYSERHLGRLFRQHIGMGAKEFSRLIRINLLLKRLEGPNVFSLTELAQEFGFYDQAHFINDFKSVCGVPPGEYRKNQSVFYNETYKF